MRNVPQTLVCPICKGPLHPLPVEPVELACPACERVWRQVDGIFDMRPESGRELAPQEKESLRHDRQTRQSRDAL